VISSNPSNGDTNVPTQTNSKLVGGANNVITTKLVTATFDEAMDPNTITTVGTGLVPTFTLWDNTLNAAVTGSVTMDATNTIATFTSAASALNAGTNYTATVSTAAKNAGSITAMPKAVAWSFTTNATPLIGQARINLLTAGNYVILADTAITNPGGAGHITGDIAVGPGVTSTAITGFGLVLPAGGAYSTSALITGKVYASDYAVPSPANMVTASTDMLNAFNEAAGRTTADTTSFPAVEIGGQTIPPGLYKWSSAVGITTDVTLDGQGNTNAVWIFQIAQDLTVASSGSVATGAHVVLINGAKASNIFWQVNGGVGTALGTYSTFNGVILTAKQINMNTGAVLNGRALAQTQVTLISNTITQPAP
jgi:hypothetical protein